MYLSFSENTCVFWNNCLSIVIKSDYWYLMNISLFVCVDVKRPPPIVRKPMSSQSIKRIKTKQEDTKVGVWFVTLIIILKYHRMYVKNKVTFWYSDLPLSLNGFQNKCISGIKCNSVKFCTIEFNQMWRWKYRYIPLNG